MRISALFILCLLSPAASALDWAELRYPWCYRVEVFYNDGRRLVVPLYRTVRHDDYGMGPTQRYEGWHNDAGLDRTIALELLLSDGRQRLYFYDPVSAWVTRYEVPTVKGAEIPCKGATYAVGVPEPVYMWQASAPAKLTVSLAGFITTFLLDLILTMTGRIFRIVASILFP